MLNCKQASQLLSEAQDRQLDRREQLPLRWHLAWCQGCCHVRAQIDLLRLATRQFPGRQDDERGD